MLQRELAFRRRFVVPGRAHASRSRAVALGLALRGAGVWSLIAGYLAGLPRERRRAADADALPGAAGVRPRRGPADRRERPRLPVAGPRRASSARTPTTSPSAACSARRSSGFYAMAFRQADAAALRDRRAGRQGHVPGVRADAPARGGRAAGVPQRAAADGAGDLPVGVILSAAAVPFAARAVRRRLAADGRRRSRCSACGRCCGRCRRRSGNLLNSLGGPASTAACRCFARPARRRRRSSPRAWAASPRSRGCCSRT